MAMLKVVILISGRGSNMQALVRAAQHPDFPAQIVGVISNRPDAAGLVWAKEQGVHTEVLDHKAFATREAFDQALDQKIAALGAQFICLAGFMRLLTPWFCAQWHDRIVNIHPSLLPAFPGLHVQQQALDYGARFSGCTVHFLRPAMDCGPIIIQAAVPVAQNDTADSLATRILEQEHIIYPKALRWIAEGRVNIHNEHCFIAQESLSESAVNPR